MAREFAENEIRPIAAEIDRDARFPHETVKRMGELGLMGIAVPERWGGSGGDMVAYVVALEEIARVCASHAVVMSVNNSLYGDPVLAFGTDAQTRALPHAGRLGPRPRLLRAHRAPGGLGRPQPGHAGACATATHYVIDRPQDVHHQRARGVVRAGVRPDRPRRGTAASRAFVVEKGTPGFTVGKTEDKLGIRASDTAELRLRRVPGAGRAAASARKGRASRSPWPRSTAGASASPPRRSVSPPAPTTRSVAYARERKSFGVPIGQHQMVQWMLADMATTIEAAGCSPSRRPPLKDAGRALHAGRGHGQALRGRDRHEGDHRRGAGARRLRLHQASTEVERYFRDAKITQIYEGTSQIQKLVIAREVLGA